MRHFRVMVTGIDHDLGVFHGATKEEVIGKLGSHVMAVEATPSERLKDLLDWESVNDFKTVELFEEWSPGETAVIVGGGRLFIKSGDLTYWLNKDRLAEFLDWVDAREDFS